MHFGYYYYTNWQAAGVFFPLDKSDHFEQENSFLGLNRLYFDEADLNLVSILY